MTQRCVLLNSYSSYAVVHCQRPSLSIFLLRMAARPNPLYRPFHQSAAEAAVSSGKKPRTMMTTAAATATTTGSDSSSDSPMKEEFAKYANYLNEILLTDGVVGITSGLVFPRVKEPTINIMEGNNGEIALSFQNDKRERVVKASRDVTINSKKIIFQVHRISKDNKEEVLMKAEQDLVAVTNQYMSKLVNELKGTDFWKLRRAYTPAVQEYVEAATLCAFCKTGTLLNLDEMNATLQPLSGKFAKPLQINVLDYLLGLADLTGELMRLAIGRISDGEVEYAQKICRFVRDIYRELTLLVPIMDDNAEMKKKMEVMLQSVVKIENACFSVHVRGSEYIPLLGSNPDYSFLGVSDF